MFTKYLLPVIAVAGVLLTTMHVMRGQQLEPAAKPMADPPRNPYAQTVAGAGVIEPQNENILIGSAMPGIVVEVFATVGQRVKRGDELFRIDDRQMLSELNYRKAVSLAAEAELSRQEHLPRPEQVPVTAAQVSEAEANMIDMEDQLNRTRELYAKKVVSANELVTREQAFRQSRSRLAKAKAEMDLLQAGAWDYDKAVARAAVAQARSQLEQTQTELERLHVRALADAEVLQVNVRPGEFVAAPANQGLIVLGNVQQLHARVDIDEHDIPRFNPDAAAKAMLKGWPQDVFPLRFVRIEPYVIPKRSLTGDNSERVDTRVLQVIYSIDPHGRRLFVGQQLDVFIEADATTR